MRTSKEKRLVEVIIKKAKEIVKRVEVRSNKRGRPRKYGEDIIFAALLIKVLEKHSYRSLESRIKELFKEVPDFSTIHYRFKRMDSSILVSVIDETVEEIVRSMGLEEFDCVIADGTGFGYADTCKLMYKRGAELREVRSHVKAEVVIGVRGGKKVVVGVNVGGAYADENNLLIPLIERLRFRGRYFLGDAYYGKNVKGLELLCSHFEEVIIPIRDGLHTKVRNKYRLMIKKKYEDRGNRDIYRGNRYKIEQLFGYVKRLLGDRDMLMRQDIAMLHVYARFILYNFIVLLDVLFLFFEILSYKWSIRNSFQLQL